MGVRQTDDGFAVLARDVARLGVEEACRRHGIHRSTWYRRVKRGDFPPAAPATEKGKWIEEIRRIALEQPAWGCDRIAYYLSFSGIRASSPTIQKILIQAGLGRRAQREQAARTQDAPGSIPP